MIHQTFRFFWQFSSFFPFFCFLISIFFFVSDNLSPQPLEKTVNPNYISPGLLPSPVDYCLGIYEDNPPVNPSSSNYCIIVTDFLY